LGCVVGSIDLLIKWEVTATPQQRGGIVRLPLDLGPVDNHHPGVDAAAIQFAVAGAKHHPVPRQA
jgi:hypothetical protein